VLALASEAAGDLTTAKILATRAAAEKGLPTPGEAGHGQDHPRTGS
jgi:hypothetical protein